MAEAATEKSPSVLVYGRISRNPTTNYPPIKGMVDYVAARLGGVGIEKGEVLLAKDEAQLIKFVQEKKVDWVTGTYYTALALKQSAEMEWLLRRWKDGVPEYHTLFLTKSESGVGSLEGLQGGKIAFENPDSTSGFMVPLVILLKNKLDLARIPTFRTPTPAGKTAYVFSGSAINTTSWVASGLVDAGVVSNVDWQGGKEIPAALKNKLRVFHKSESFPRAMEMVRQDLPPALKQQLKEVLKHIHQQPEGVAVLEKFSHTARFDDLPDDALTGLEQASAIMPLITPHIQP